MTDPLGVEDVWNDLHANLAHLKTIGIDQVNVLFGFSWGKFIYAEEKKWYEIPVAVKDLEVLIRQAHENGHGALGHDNLYISPSPNLRSDCSTPMKPIFISPSPP